MSKRIRRPGMTITHFDWQDDYELPRPQTRAKVVKPLALPSLDKCLWLAGATVWVLVVSGILLHLGAR